MARLPELYKQNLPLPMQKGFRYIVEQKRAYTRIDGKFVGMGFDILLRKQDGSNHRMFVYDDQLQNYPY